MWNSRINERNLSRVFLIISSVHQVQWTQVYWYVKEVLFHGLKEECNTNVGDHKSWCAGQLLGVLEFIFTFSVILEALNKLKWTVFTLIESFVETPMLPTETKWWCKFGIHWVHQQWTPWQRETIALVPFQGEPSHGQWKDNRKPELHQPWWYIPMSVGHRHLEKL